MPSNPLTCIHPNSQHFQKLRLAYQGPNASPAKRTKATSATGTPSKKPKPTKSFMDLSNDSANGNGNGNGESSAGGSGNAGFAHDDDDEEFGSPSPSKRKRVMKSEGMMKSEGEEAAGEAQSAPLFKMEHADAGRPVDLEQDE